MLVLTQDKMSKLERVKTEAMVLCDHKSHEREKPKKMPGKIGTMFHCRLHPFDVIIPSFTGPDDVSVTRFVPYSVTTLPQPKSHPLGDFMIEFVGDLKLGKIKIFYSTFNDKIMSYL